MKSERRDSVTRMRDTLGMKIIRTMLWLVAAVTVGIPVTEAGPIPTTPTYTSKTRLRIPFHQDPEEMRRMGAKEIRLFVSQDRGCSWTQAQKVATNARHFNFQAPNDGEYWFGVKTVDRNGRLQPDGDAVDTALQVIVDSTLPQLRLELQSPAPGWVQINWTAADEHLDPTNLRLEYRQSGMSEWQKVSIVPKATGQTKWSVPQGGIVAVRGWASDLARNTAQDETQLNVAAANESVPRPSVPDLRQPIAGNNNLPDQFSAMPGGQPQPQDQFQNAFNGPRGNFVSHPGTREPQPENNTARYRIVNSRRFQIGYKLQDVGPSGVSTVELYITNDEGRTWFRYGTDDDNQSPFQVDVPKEGTYGFSLGVRSGAGLASEPPQNGDKPSIVVVVDQTPPQLQLLPLEQGRGRSANKIRIQWRFHDDFPSDKPIALYYSPNGQAPWQPISGWTENTGGFIWNMGPNVPSRFFLRIEGRDMAGNTQVVETPKPVLIDLSRPTAKIIDIEAGSGPQ